MRKSKRMLFILVAVLVLLGASAIAYAAGHMPDIAGHWAEDEITRMADKGITEGHEDGTFGPEEYVTRAQMMVFMDRLDQNLSGDGGGGMDAEGCKDCHDDSALITSKQTSWSTSTHGDGTAYDYAGGRSGCTGCHSGNGFSAMIAAGQNPTEVESASSEPTRQDCRACHQIHTSYTGDDWALATTDAVEMYPYEGDTYDGGEGNLCVNCHVSRHWFEEYVDGDTAEVTSSHWGAHHGPQSDMLLGRTGAEVDGNASAHYSIVGDTCVACHLGEDDNHSFAPEADACQSCHSGADSLDVNGVQTEVQDKLDQLEEDLIGAGMLTEDGSPVEGTYEKDKAAALWNWLYVEEENSLGVHNPSFTNDMLDAGLEAFNE